MNRYEYTKPSRMSAADLTKYSSIKNTSLILNDWVKQISRAKQSTKHYDDLMEEIIRKRIDNGETDDLSIYLRSKIGSDSFDSEIKEFITLIEDGNTKSLYDIIYSPPKPRVSEIVTKKNTKKITKRWKAFISNLLKRRAKKMGWRPMDSDLSNVSYEMSKNII